MQRELAEERRAIRDFVHGDALLRRFFTVFLFEDLPATDHRADELYLDEVDRCDLFVTILGAEYGSTDAEGVSPTEREFDRASECMKVRLVFIKDVALEARHSKTQALIRRVESQLVRRTFGGTAELIGGLYAALVQYLEDTDQIRSGPFDSAPCRQCTLDDLSLEHMQLFIRNARQGRGFPLPESAAGQELLAHLNLLDEGRPTQAAVLLFGKQPQRFLLSSAVKCAHFHGTEVAKPIPSYQVYKGTAFELIDQAVDFVLSKLDLYVGTRTEGTAAPGALPPSLTLGMLRVAHGSVPGNPLLAESLYLARYIERMGTGTRDMIARCLEFGLEEPEFEQIDGFRVTLARQHAHAGLATPRDMTGTKSGPSRVQVKILRKCIQQQSITALLKLTGRSNRTKFRDQVLRPLLADGLLERTIPDKPTSSRQKHRITALGRRTLALMDAECPA